MNIKVPMQDWPSVDPFSDPNDPDLPWYSYYYGYIPFCLAICFSWTISFVSFLIFRYKSTFNKMDKIFRM